MITQPNNKHNDNNPLEKVAVGGSPGFASFVERARLKDNEFKNKYKMNNKQTII